MPANPALGNQPVNVRREFPIFRRERRRVTKILGPQPLQKNRFIAARGRGRQQGIHAGCGGGQESALVFIQQRVEPLGWNVLPRSLISRFENFSSREEIEFIGAVMAALRTKEFVQSSLAKIGITAGRAGDGVASG